MSTSLAIILSVIIAVILYLVLREKGSPEADATHKPDLSEEVNQSEMLAEASRAITTTLKMAEVWSELQPITAQMQIGIKEREVPKGGIFDSYVRGYLMGYVNSLLEISGEGGINRSPHRALEIFSIMFGAGFGNDQAGLDEFNECLRERSKPENSSADSLFMKGFQSGAIDYKKHHLGQRPESLSEYIDAKMASA